MPTDRLDYQSYISTFTNNSPLSEGFIRSEGQRVQFTTDAREMPRPRVQASRSRPSLDRILASMRNPFTASEATSDELLEDNQDMRICSMFPNHSNYVKPIFESHPLVLTNEMLGVEIELENIHSGFRSNYWRVTEDGSLRNNGREYVFRQPLGGRDVFLALSEIGKHLHEIQPDPSWRCSTHVHLDVRDLETPQLKKLLLIYTIYEQTMFKCSGYNRYRNNFGPAYGFAQQQISTLSRNWNKQGRDFVRSVLSSWSKYTSLNLLPISRFGSVEFRISNPMVTTSDLLRLCNRILMLKKLAVEWEGTEKELIEHCMNSDPSDVFNKKLLGMAVNGVDRKDIIEGCILANDIIELRTFSLAGSGQTVTIRLMHGILSVVRNQLRGYPDSSEIPEGFHEWINNPTPEIEEEYLVFMTNNMGFGGEFFQIQDEDSGVFSEEDF